MKKESAPANNDDRFPVGTVVGLHGLNGQLKIRPETNNPALLLPIKSVQVERGDAPPMELAVNRIKLDKRMIFLTLRGYPDRTSVEQFVGARVFTRRKELKMLDEDEWWTTDLIGLQVYTTDGAHVGTICDIVGQAGDFLEIKKIDDPDGETALVPFVKALVPTVDIKGGRVELVNLPGLLD